MFVLSLKVPAFEIITLNFELFDFDLHPDFSYNIDHDYDLDWTCILDQEQTVSLTIY